MAHFHTFIPSESKFDYSNIDADDFGSGFISQMQKIENYTDLKVNSEFNKKMDEQWEEERFTVSLNNLWDTYEPVRDFLEENENNFTVKQKRAILMYLYERDAILKKIKIGDWSYYEYQSYIGSNIQDILSGSSISKRSESEEKAKAKKTKARKKEEADNKIIKSMKKSDLTSNQRKKIEYIEDLATVIEEEAESDQSVPNLIKNWWKVAHLDKFLARKKNELEQMRISNEEYRNFKKEEEQEKGACTVM